MTAPDEPMSETTPLTPGDREDLVSYLDEEADAAAEARVQTLLEKNPRARTEKQLFEQSWQLLDALARPSASDGFKERTASMAFLAAPETVAASVPEAADSRSPSKFGFAAISWAGAAILGAAAGFLAVSLVPDPNRQLLRDLPILQRLDQFRAAGNVTLLRDLKENKTLDALQAVSAPTKGGRP